MSAAVLRNANKVHRYINTITSRHSISRSTDPPILRSHFRQEPQLTKAFHSRFPARRTKDLDFSVPVRSFSTKTNGRSLVGSITDSAAIGWYLGMIKARPVLTKAITSAVIYTAADLTSQTMTKSTSEDYDVIRTCRMAGYGLIILGPALHVWFNFVSRVLPKQDIITTFKKMFMGQAIMGPIITAVFFSFNATLQGEKGNEIVARLKRDMLPTLINNALYWPICDFITFRFVPVHLQPLMSSSFSYVWTIYLTYMANLAKAGAN